LTVGKSSRSPRTSTASRPAQFLCVRSSGKARRHMSLRLRGFEWTLHFNVSYIK
jgi:hypothetical protein